MIYQRAGFRVQKPLKNDIVITSYRLRLYHIHIFTHKCLPLKAKDPCDFIVGVQDFSMAICLERHDHYSGGCIKTEKLLLS